jgi:hypothetical protein
MVSVRLREPDPTPLGGMGSQPDGSKVDSNALFLQVHKDSLSGLWEWRSSPQCSTALRCQRGAETQSSMITINNGARLGLRLHEKAARNMLCPCIPCSKRIFDEYIGRRPSVRSTPRSKALIWLKRR